MINKINYEVNKRSGHMNSFKFANQLMLKDAFMKFKCLIHFVHTT